MSGLGADTAVLVVMSLRPVEGACALGTSTFEVLVSSLGAAAKKGDNASACIGANEVSGKDAHEQERGGARVWR